ncbi:hypothetical protein PCE1_000396 [Barthelona sp. PCE]
MSWAYLAIFCLLSCCAAFQYDLMKLTKYPDDCGFKGTLRLSDVGDSCTGPSRTACQSELIVEFDCYTHDMFRFQVKSEHKRVPMPLPGTLTAKNESTTYKISLKTNPFALNVTKKETGEEIFFADSKMFLSDQFMHFSLNSISHESIYGLGYRNNDFKVMRDGRYLKLWNYDPAGCPQGDGPCYSTHPVFFGKVSARTSRTVLLNNYRAMQIQAHRDRLEYNVLGGDIDFIVFAKNSFREAIESYLEWLPTPQKVPAFLLGWQQSKWGYKTLDEVKKVVEKYESEKIPLDIQYCDIDYMDKYFDFTVDPKNFPMKDMQEFIKDLNENDRHLGLIFDPGIYALDSDYDVYNDLVQGGGVIKTGAGAPYVGEVWPGKTVFPDFTVESTKKWWKKNLRAFHNDLPFSLAWIDMNEPSNFVNTPNQCDYIPGNPNCPPYRIGDLPRLSHNTIPMDTFSSLGSTADTHSLYSRFEGDATIEAFADHPKRMPIITRSSSPGTSTYSWLGDGFANWETLRQHITGHMQHQAFGLKVTGADICGFIGMSSEELCARWIQFGAAFSTYSRSHKASDYATQAPYTSSLLTTIAKKAIRQKYAFFPIFYSVLNTEQSLLLRPPMYSFNDKYIEGLTYQFMLGDAFMACPVIYEGMNSVSCHLPASASPWFDLAGNRLDEYGDVAYIDAPMDKELTVAVPSGRVFALHDVSDDTLTIEQARQTELILYATNPNKAQEQGSFKLFLDDGISVDTKGAELNVDIHVTSNQISLDIISCAGPYKDVKVKELRFINPGKFSKIYVDGKSTNNFVKGNNMVILTLNETVCSLNLIVLA